MPLQSRSFAFLLLVATLCATPPANAAPGDLDPTFDGDGIVANALEGEASAVVIQGDGKIVAALGTNFGVVRYETNGSLDTGFGSSGRATADFGVGGQISTAALIAPDGKIVVSGIALPSPPASSQLAIVRFDVNGALDPTFGTGGKTLTDIPVDVSDFTDTMVRLPSGRLVTGGSAFMGGTHGVLVAYDDAGALDPGFGSGGIVLTTEPISISALAVSGSQIIAVGSSSDGHLAVARFAFDGTAGPVITLPNDGSFATGLAIDLAGRIVVAGGTNNCNDTIVARFLADGTLDLDFGLNGVAIIDVVTPATAACGDFAKALIQQPDGRILVASEGQTYDAPPSPLTLSTWWLLRLDPDGALDVSFGNDGLVFMDDAVPRAMALQRDGKAVTAGFNETAIYDPPFAIYLETSLMLTRHEAMAAPVCSAGPRSGCGMSGGARSSTLKLSRRSGKAPTLHWSWKKGTATAADFGAPTTGGSYALCVYDGSSTLVGTAQVEGGGICKGRPCWKATGPSGWGYESSRGTVFGIDKVKIKTGSGKAAFDFQGRHANLPVLPLPATLPLRVQMQTSAGSCFEAVFPIANRNDATDFSAKN